MSSDTKLVITHTTVNNPLGVFYKTALKEKMKKCY